MQENQQGYNAMYQQELTRKVPVQLENPNQSYPGSIEVLTDPSSVLFELELTLRGIRVGHNNHYVQYDEPLMNKKGIIRIIGIAQSIVNQVSNLSNYNENDVNNLIKSNNRLIVMTLLRNKKEFEIKEPSKDIRDTIHKMILNLDFSTIKRAYMQGEREFWGKSHHDIRQTVVNNNQEKKGIFSKIFR